MSKNWTYSDVIQNRISDELSVIQTELEKTVIMGDVVDRSARIAAEMNFLRNEIGGLEQRVASERRMSQSYEDTI